MKFPATAKNLAFCLAAMAPGFLAADIILHQWTFQSGTDLRDTPNTGVDASNILSITGGGAQQNFGEIRPDGAFRIYGDDATIKWFNFASRYDVNSHNGIFSLKLVVQGWDFSDFGEGGRTFVTALQPPTRPGLANPGNFPRFLVVNTETGVNLNIQTNNVGEGTTGITNSGAIGLPRVNTDTSYTFESILDFNEGVVYHFFEGVLLGSFEGVVDTEIDRVGFSRFGPGGFGEPGAWLDHGSLTITALNELPALTQSWAGYEIVDGWVDTGDFMGQLFVTAAPWVYSVTLGKWIVIPEDSVSDLGGWVFARN